jgi:hypothetical protein
MKLNLLAGPAGPIAQYHRPLGVRKIVVDGRLSQTASGMS